MERRNGLPHAVVYALPEQDPTPDLGSLALPPPVQLEFAHPVAAADPAGSVFGAEGEATLGGGVPGRAGAGGAGVGAGRDEAGPMAAPAAGAGLGAGARAEEEAFALELGDQGPAASDVVRLVYSSLVTPRSTYDVNVRTGAPPARPPRLPEPCILASSFTFSQPSKQTGFFSLLILLFFGGCEARSARQPSARARPAGAKALRKQQAAGGYDRALFRSTRLWAPSTGGVEARARI